MQTNEAIKILQFETVKNALRTVAEYRCFGCDCDDCSMYVNNKCISVEAFDILDFLEVKQNENK